MITMVTELNEQTFDSFVKQKGIVVVDCWAPWCGPCRMMMPIIEEVSNELAGKVTVGKLNTDENQGVASKFGISAIPTLLIFKDGVVLEPLVGLRPKDELLAYLCNM